MGHVGSKFRSIGQILEKPCVRRRGYIFSPSIMKGVRMFVLMKSEMTLKMGHVESKTRSLGQILQKPCVRSRGHMFSLLILKLGQNVWLNKISYEFENGSYRVKK